MKNSVSNKIQKSTGEKIFDIANVVILILLAGITLYPFIHTISVAFSTRAESIRAGLHWYPKEVDFEPMITVLSGKEIWVAYGYTIFRTVIGTALSVICTGMGAYALSKPFLPYKKALTMIALFAMFFHGGLIPSYLVIRSLGMIDSIWSMILPQLVWGFNLIVMRNFFEAIPESLEESAKLDGATDMQVFLKIYVPLSKPVIATIGMWMAVYHWNAYMDNLMYINDSSKYVLQRLIRNLLITSDTGAFESLSDASALSSESLKSATILVSTVPILLVYPFMQKYFIKGVMVGAVKG